MIENVLSQITWLKKIAAIFPKKVLFGVGCFDDIGAEAKTLGATRALLVIDPIVAKLGIMERAKRSLENQQISFEVFDGVEPEPHIEIVHKTTQIVKGGNFDLVVGIGGGSALDIAKATAIMAANPGTFEDYIGFGKVKR